jgi:hypothetical protein
MKCHLSTALWVTTKFHPLPDDAQRRVLIFDEAECDSTGSGFFNFKNILIVIANPTFVGEAI